MKVIGAGFGRTGTNSFQVAMEMLGFAPCHHMNVLMQSPPDLDAWERAAAGTLTDWDELYGDFAATCDFPHCVFYRELAEFYPEAKVVLTVRDADDWYESARTTIFSPGQAARVDAGELGGITRSLLTIVGRVVDLAQVGDKDATITAFNRHNEQVQATVPPDRLLVYDVADGWDPLCAFLDVPVPSEPFPHTNTSEEFQARALDRPAD